MNLIKLAKLAELVAATATKLAQCMGASSKCERIRARGNYLATGNSSHCVVNRGLLAPLRIAQLLVVPHDALRIVPRPKRSFKASKACIFKAAWGSNVI